MEFKRINSLKFEATHFLETKEILNKFYKVLREIDGLPSKKVIFENKEDLNNLERSVILCQTEIKEGRHVLYFQVRDRDSRNLDFHNAHTFYKGVDINDQDLDLPLY